eukprot:XP_001707685.1 Hypothetical protein GL50803_33301 [Giardia lamblia ATCC 50803]
MFSMFIYNLVAQTGWSGHTCDVEHFNSLITHIYLLQNILEESLHCYFFCIYSQYSA